MDTAPSVIKVKIINQNMYAALDMIVIKLWEEFDIDKDFQKD